MTIVLKPTRENIKRAAKAMEMGAIVIYPTESSYAIGCDFTNQEGINEIYKIKKRKKSKFMITIVSSIEIAKKYGKINKAAEILIKRFMPGPLTLVVPGKGRKLDKFRFRITENRIAKMLANELEKPIIATSANISEKGNIYNADELEQFFGKVDAILDNGNLPQRENSTIVSINDKQVRFIREGAISKEKIKKALMVK